MTVREAEIGDLACLQELYREHLIKNPPPEPPDILGLQNILQKIINDNDYHLLIGEAEGRIVSSVTLVIIRNLTHNGRPYSVIENVVTHGDFRGRRYASRLMEKASEIACGAGCYKVMLLTGSKKDSTLRFYERCGFNRNDKTAFIKWL